MALGRGLDALLKGPTAAPTTTPVAPPAPQPAPPESPTDRLMEIPLAQVVPNPDQPRLQFDEEKIEELAQSIQSQGLIQPIVVRKVGEQYQLIAGERRVRACRRIGLRAVPARVMVDEDDGDLEKALVENLQREDLNPIHEALAYQKMMERLGLTQEQISDRVGKKRTTVANTLRLLRLPEAIQEDILAGRLSEGHARALLGESDPERQMAIRAAVLREGLSVRETEQRVKAGNGTGAPVSASKGRAGSAAADQAEVRELQERLTLRLGARVQILARSTRKGKIVIPYHTLDDFERIMAILGVEIDA